MFCTLGVRLATFFGLGFAKVLRRANRYYGDRHSASSTFAASYLATLLSGWLAGCAPPKFLVATLKIKKCSPRDPLAHGRVHLGPLLPIYISPSPSPSHSHSPLAQPLLRAFFVTTTKNFPGAGRRRRRRRITIREVR